MKRQMQKLLLTGMVGCFLLSQIACTDWSNRKKWPEKYKFQGQTVQFHQDYITGDQDVPDVQKGQSPSIRHTYYSYVKAGKEIRHGKSTCWYDDSKKKTETTYVHGVRQDFTAWYPNGKICEKVEKSPDGEERTFFDKNGKRIGVQYYDRKSKKRTFVLRGKIVPKDDFIFEINRLVYRVDRITP